MDKLKMHTPDLADENFKKLAALFPNAVTETITGYDDDGNAIIERAIDADVLRQEISAQVVEGAQERYQFTWPDKKKSVILANQPIAKTLRLDREKSVGRDGTSGSIDTENIYIEGDNLDALKLLQETYLGKVKMIYIDPPYNTGNDFIYEDDFSQETGEYLGNSGQFDEEGKQLVQNAETKGRFHTDWLNMINTRLRLAKDLLTDDGAIFISIGDDEEANLIKVCDEVFGEHNFIASICHKSRASVSNDRIISENHNHLLFYARKMDVLFAHHKEIGDDPELSGFDKEDENGKYKLTPVDGPGGAKKGNPYYEFLGVTGYWRYSKQTMQEKYDKGLIVNTGNNLQQKYYLSQAIKSRKTVTTWWDTEFLTSSATTDFIKLMGGKYFDNPKNINLLTRCLKMITKFDEEAIILDFFSGSATTAHAVMKFNAEDGGKRKFILVQIPAAVEETDEAQNAGFSNICEIGEERIRRAGNKIKEESPLTTDDLDIGFRVFKVDSTNMNDVYYRPKDYKQGQMSFLANNIKADRTPEDLLFQVMLDLGVLLSSKIEEKTIAQKKVFSVADGYLIACFDNNVTEETVKAIAQKKPFYAVFRDSGMASDSVMTNFEQIFETYSPKTQRKVL